MHGNGKVSLASHRNYARRQLREFTRGEGLESRESKEGGVWGPMAMLTLTCLHEVQALARPLRKLGPELEDGKPGAREGPP